jgi:hypothetical protein
VTDADLDAIAYALEAERARWAGLILPRVEGVLADAHAHAQKAVTDALKVTPDGRPTLRRANRSPSFQAALNRLGELRTWLAGPSEVSLEGKVRDARATFYKLAFTLHTPHIPGKVRVAADPAPTQRNINLVRGAPVHGYDVRKELEKPFVDAARQLSSAVALAGSSATSDRDAGLLLKAWHARARGAIERAVLSLLSDSAEHANTEAMGDLVHPDYRS